MKPNGIDSCVFLFFHTKAMLASNGDTQSTQDTAAAFHTKLSSHQVFAAVLKHLLL